jgi:hypothetical protein
MSLFLNFRSSTRGHLDESKTFLQIDQKASDFYGNVPKAIFVAIGDDIDDSN